MSRPVENSKLRSVPDAMLERVERILKFYRANRNAEFEVHIVMNGKRYGEWISDEAPDDGEVVTVITEGGAKFVNVEYRCGQFHLPLSMRDYVKCWMR